MVRLWVLHAPNFLTEGALGVEGPNTLSSMDGDDDSCLYKNPPGTAMKPARGQPINRHRLP